MPKKMNHGEYQAKVKKMSDAALRFVIQDAREAMAAMPDGENAGYYADEIHYCCKEIERRREARKLQFRKEARDTHTVLTGCGIDIGELVLTVGSGWMYAASDHFHLDADELRELSDKITELNLKETE